MIPIAVALLQSRMASGAHIRHTSEVVDNKNADNTAETLAGFVKDNRAHEELRFGDDDKNCKTLELNFVLSEGTFTAPMDSLSFYHPTLKNEDGAVVAELVQSCSTLVAGAPGAGIRDMCQLVLLFLPLESGIFQDQLFGLRTHAAGPGAITGGTGDYKCASGTLEFAIDPPNNSGGLTLDYCLTPSCP